jgi:hypothetical protein
MEDYIKSKFTRSINPIVLIPNFNTLPANNYTISSELIETTVNDFLLQYYTNCINEEISLNSHVYILTFILYDVLKTIFVDNNIRFINTIYSGLFSTAFGKYIIVIDDIYFIDIFQIRRVSNLVNDMIIGFGISMTQEERVNSAGIPLSYYDSIKRAVDRGVTDMQYIINFFRAKHTTFVIDNTHANYINYKYISEPIGGFNIFNTYQEYLTNVEINDSGFINHRMNYPYMRKRIV